MSRFIGNVYTHIALLKGCVYDERNNDFFGGFCKTHNSCWRKKSSKAYERKRISRTIRIEFSLSSEFMSLV